MNCAKVSELAMKFLDGEITIESEELSSHLQKCEKCRNDFVYYSIMKTHLSDIDIISAPEDFEAQIMTKVEVCEMNYALVSYKASNDKIVLVAGYTSVVFGAGIIFGMYINPIVASLKDNALIGQYVGKYDHIFNTLIEASNYSQNVVLSVFTNIKGYFPTYQIISLILIILGVSYQFHSYNKKGKLTDKV